MAAEGDLQCFMAHLPIVKEYAHRMGFVELVNQGLDCCLWVAVRDGRQVQMIPPVPVGYLLIVSKGTGKTGASARLLFPVNDP